MEWINVQDKLPEMHRQVIVRMFVGEVAISSVQYENYTEADQTIHQMKTWADLINPQVTHWTPLPDLLEEDECD